MVQKKIFMSFVASVIVGSAAFASELPLVAQGKIDDSLGDPIVSTDDGAALPEVTARIIPTVWVDPDGCQHWVFDDGVEGYMTPHVTRDGIPVCERGISCGSIEADQLFAVDSATISTEGRTTLEEFFSGSGASEYVIEGHTDSDASDAYNMALSERRARAVASIAQAVGASTDVRWYGERQPVASNETADGRAQNRRVEISCVN